MRNPNKICCFYVIASILFVSGDAYAQHFIEQPFTNKNEVRVSGIDGNWNVKFKDTNFRVVTKYKGEANSRLKRQTDWLYFEVQDAKSAELESGLVSDSNSLSGTALTYVISGEIYLVFGDFQRPFPSSLNAISALPVYSLYKLEKANKGFLLYGLNRELLSKKCVELDIDFLASSSFFLVDGKEDDLSRIIEAKSGFEKIAVLRRRK